MQRGFTIVELLIVVIVIAVLATVIVVGYGNISKRALGSILKDTLSQTAQAMEVMAVEGEDFSSIPSKVTLASGVGVGLAQVDDQSSFFCINATHQSRDDISYYMARGSTPREGLCEGEVIATLGDYNARAGGANPDDPSLTMPSAAHVVAPGDLEFTATTDDKWMRVDFSWKAIPGATQYRLNHRSTPTGTWYARPQAFDGTGGTSWDNTSTIHTGLIAASTTSLYWTTKSYIPQDLSQTHEYRMQYKKSDGSWSDFQQLSLSPMEGRTLPTIKNFKATPSSDWSQMTLTWSSLKNFANLPGVKLRINHRSSSAGDWRVRTPSPCGNSNVGSSTTYSGTIPAQDTMSLWTGPACTVQNAEQTHEFRIQLYSGPIESEWSYSSVNALTHLGLPELSTPKNFKVTPSPDWSTITLSWDSMAEYAAIPNTNLRINHRGSSASAWSVRSTSCGSSNVGDSVTYSGSTPISDVQISWPRGTACVPSDVDQTHEYRIQAYSGSIVTGWATVSLNQLSWAGVSALPKVQNFKVTPAPDWSSITVSWDPLDNKYVNLPGLRMRVNHRSSTSGSWNVHTLSSSGLTSNLWDSTTYSGSTPLTSTSILWGQSSYRPAVGETHEYRIQLYSGTQTGEWSTVQLSR